MAIEEPGSVVLEAASGTQAPARQMLRFAVLLPWGVSGPARLSGSQDGPVAPLAFPFLMCLEEGTVLGDFPFMSSLLQFVNGTRSRSLQKISLAPSLVSDEQCDLNPT